MVGFFAELSLEVGLQCCEARIDLGRKLGIGIVMRLVLNDSILIKTPLDLGLFVKFSF